MTLKLKAIFLPLALLVASCELNIADSPRDGNQKAYDLQPNVVETLGKYSFEHDTHQLEVNIDTGPRLVLKPVRCPSHIGPTSLCTEIGAENARIWVFQGENIISDVSLPCMYDKIDVGTLEPGEYKLAILCKSSSGSAFVAGLILIEGQYVPDYQHCIQDSAYRGCNPVNVLVEKTGSTVVPVNLYCHDMLSGGPDTCGGP